MNIKRSYIGTKNWLLLFIACMVVFEGTLSAVGKALSLSDIKTVLSQKKTLKKFLNPLCKAVNPSDLGNLAEFAAQEKKFSLILEKAFKKLPQSLKSINGLQEMLERMMTTHLRESESFSWCICEHISLVERYMIIFELLEYVMKKYRPEEALSYCSLGSGDLLQDALFFQELAIQGYKNITFHLIDSSYVKQEILNQGQPTFEHLIRKFHVWLNERGFSSTLVTENSAPQQKAIHCYSSVIEYLAACQNFKELSWVKADILVMVDPGNPFGAYFSEATHVMCTCQCSAFVMDYNPAKITLVSTATSCMHCKSFAELVKHINRLSHEEWLLFLMKSKSLQSISKNNYEKEFKALLMSTFPGLGSYADKLSVSGCIIPDYAYEQMKPFALNSSPKSKAFLWGAPEILYV